MLFTLAVAVTPVAEPYGGKVYVLTSAATFSSAVIFTYLLQDNHLATVVGQSPSNNPNSYGDVIPLRLPNSRLRWIMTYKYSSVPTATTTPPHRSPRHRHRAGCGTGRGRRGFLTPRVAVGAHEEGAGAHHP